MRLFSSLQIIHFLLDKATTSLVDLKGRKVRPDANRGFFFFGVRQPCCRFSYDTGGSEPERVASPATTKENAPASRRYLLTRVFSVASAIFSL